MKKLAIFCSIVFLFMSTNLQAIEDQIMAEEPIGKLIKEQGDVHLKRYGVRAFYEKNTRHLKGLYKINIGNPHTLQRVNHLSKMFGFAGWIFTKTHEDSKYWYKVVIHRPDRQMPGWKETIILTKDKLPEPFNAMSDEFLEKIHFFNIYPDNGHVAVVYIMQDTAMSDCEAIFDYFCKKLT